MLLLFFLLLLLLFIFLLSPPPSGVYSAPIPTVAVVRTHNSTLVCALLPNPSDRHRPALNCTDRLSLKVFPYPSNYYTGLVAGDGFLCALSSPSPSHSSIFWWSFTNSSPPSFKRLYHGDRLAVLSSGDSHVCGLISTTHRIYCWRWPFLCHNTPPFSDLAVGNDFVCGLLHSGKIRCFGEQPTVVGNEPDGGFSTIAAGASHACGLTNPTHHLRCWGSGHLPDAPPEAQYHSVAVGLNRTCAVRSNSTVVCWGGGGFRLPTRWSEMKFLSVTARGPEFCAVRENDYALVCWGTTAVEANPVAFTGVLPGVCTAVSSCPCNNTLPGSSDLCPPGDSICAACPLEISPPPPLPRRSRRVALYAGIAAAVLIFVGSIVILRWKFSRRIHDGSLPPPLKRRSGISLVEEFPLRLLLSITDGFSDDHRVGSGSFGSVYHAVLDDGRHVAIKRAEPPRASAVKEQSFLSELALLSRVNHVNLVRLLGFCEEELELVLVYEHVPNGSLHEHLHVLRSSPLSGWVPRMRVALEAARGVEYLHRFAVPPIIHRDIKPSNILLDDTWTAKIADFGLGTDGRSGPVVFPTAGTLGYMDPKYYTTERLTEKSDVYSFGVVLLELLTGRKAIHRRASCNGEICNVVDFAVPKILADEVAEVLDPALPPPGPCEIEAVQQLGYLAAECVSLEGDGRPAMADVVDELHRAVSTCLAAPPPLTRSMRSCSV